MSVVVHLHASHRLLVGHRDQGRQRRKDRIAQRIANSVCSPNLTKCSGPQFNGAVAIPPVERWEGEFGSEELAMGQLKGLKG